MVALRKSLVARSISRLDRRWGTRLPIRLPVEVRVGRTLHSLYTHDVGLEGIFLTTAEPPASHQLLQLTLDLPPFAEKVRFLGVVERTVTPVEAVVHGRPPGMGVYLYGLTEATRRDWRRFVEASRTEFDKAGEPYTLSPRGTSDGPFLFRISTVTFADLANFLYTALLQEGIVLVEVPPDTNNDNARVVVSVVHYDTGTEFHVPGEVVYSGAASTSTVVRFFGVSKRTIEGFEHFLRYGTPPPFDHDSTNLSEELAMYEDAHKTQGDIGNDPPRFAEVSAFHSVAPTFPLLSNARA